MSDTTRLKHDQRTVWKDGIDLELCFDNCPACAVEAELNALRTGIVEAVKAAEEATREAAAQIIDQFEPDEYNPVPSGQMIRILSTGELDRYVASKVREAKIAAYERCERASYGSKIIALLFNEWAAAERKKKGSQNVNP